VTAVEVNVTNGVVTLAGPVHSDDEKQKAETVARDVEGVRRVNKALQVMPIESSPVRGACTSPAHRANAKRRRSACTSSR
jgi:BON domain